MFLVGGWLLALALLPAIAAGGGVPLSTCLLTGAVIWAYTGTFIATKQRVSALGTGASAVLWTVLLVQAAIG